MNFAETVRQWQKRGKRPAALVLASQKPLQINQILMCGEWRVKISEVLTRKEFLRRHQENEVKFDGNFGVTPVENSKARLDKSYSATEVPEHCRYYYAAVLHE